MDGKSDKTKKKDLLLGKIIEYIGQEKQLFNITLNIKGLIISGYLISQEEYYKQLVEQFCLIFGADNQLSHPVAQTEYEEGYIYLMNAKFHFASQDAAPIDQGVLWRGDLNAIDGYFFGSLD